MIQIQDDNFNQSASAPSLDQNQTPSPAPSSSPSTANPSDKSSEIDQLLAELDKLSKDLEEKPAVQSSEKLSNPESIIDKPASTEEPVLAKESTASDDKFDFDGFLSDLEKQIEEQTSKSQEIGKSESEDSKSADFRKNRPAIDPQAEDEMLKDETEVPEPIIKTGVNSEELKAQNIFEMLGLEKISDEEKNQFLDDLEAMIWDDFVAHDLELLLTSEEYAGAREILDKKDLGEEQQKEDLIAYLEKLVPDLDEVLYDKALELKSEMMGERLAKMKENADQTVLAKIKEAEDLISQNHWKSAVSLLNQLS